MRMNPAGLTGVAPAVRGARSIGLRHLVASVVGIAVAGAGATGVGARPGEAMSFDVVRRAGSVWAVVAPEETDGPLLMGAGDVTSPGRTALNGLPYITSDAARVAGHAAVRAVEDHIRGIWSGDASVSARRRFVSAWVPAPVSSIEPVYESVRAYPRRSFDGDVSSDDVLVELTLTGAIRSVHVLWAVEIGSEIRRASSSGLVDERWIVVAAGLARVQATAAGGAFVVVDLGVGAGANVFPPELAGLYPSGGVLVWPDVERTFGPERPAVVRTGGVLSAVGTIF
jgi:hypothetical protein